MVHRFISLLETLFGRFADRERHRAVLRAKTGVGEVLKLLRSRFNVALPVNDEEKPIFILSAGWRSGSTLLQRLVLSDRAVLIWGEPYAHCDLVRSMADSLCCFSTNEPNESFFIDQPRLGPGASGELADRWVANLYPQPAELLQAHRSFFLNLYQEPAVNRGFSRWGFKEVRLSAEYALYLKFLFPHAKFVFLYRNPYDAYRSYKSFRAWYDVWPSQPIFTARRYGIMWRRLITSFFEKAEELDAFLVKFEDLVSGAMDRSALANYLEVDTVSAILEKRISGERALPVDRLTGLERRMVASVVNPVARELGYATPHYGHYPDHGAAAGLHDGRP